VEMQPPGVMRYPGGYDYYREKVAQREGTSLPLTAPRAAGTQADRKVERRKRAEQVQTLSRQRRAHERTMAKAEKKIEELEQDRATLLEGMVAPAEQTDYATTNQKLTDIQKEIDGLTRAWEMAANAVDALQP